MRKCWKILKFNKRWGLNNSLAAIFFSNLINGEFFCTIIRGIWVEQLPIINKWCHLLLETWEYFLAPKYFLVCMYYIPITFETSGPHWRHSKRVHASRRPSRWYWFHWNSSETGRTATWNKSTRWSTIQRTIFIYNFIMSRRCHTTWV